MIDNYLLWKAHDDEQERWLRKRPVCAECNEHIQDDHSIEIDGDLIHEDCIKDYMTKRYRVVTEDYIN